MASATHLVETTQVVVILDIEGALPNAEILAQLPPIQHHRVLVRASEYGAPGIVREGAERSPVDWDGLAVAVTGMVDDIRSAGVKRGHPSEYVVVGRAPLPVFVHAGLALSAWAQPLTMLNRRKDGSWDCLLCSGDAHAGAFFDGASLREDAEPSEASGRVGVFVSTGATVSHGQVDDFVRQLGDRIAGIVEIRPKTTQFLTAANAAGVAQQLVDMFTRIAAAYPRRTGLALFVAGPATLGFLVGRAINPRVFDDVAVANLAGADYELAFMLPRQSADDLTLASDPDAADARERALDEFRSAINSLRETLLIEDLPSSMESAAKERLLRELQVLQVGPTAGSEFSLSVLRHQLLIGESLLEAFRGLESAALKTIASLLVLHEIYHTSQGIQSTNFRDIGRAGTALEQIDFFADAISVETLTRCYLRTGPADTKVADVSMRLIEAVLLGMKAFDCATPGSMIHRLPERRLRRYLIWHLQRQRASTVTSLEQIATLFSDRLVVELAPVRGFLDQRFDKIVKEAMSNTELVVACGRRITRYHKRPGFDPAGLLDAVRVFDTNVLRAAMDFVIHETGDLVPWAF